MRKAPALAVFAFLAVVMPSGRAWAQTVAAKAPHVRVLSTNGLIREGRLLELTSSEVVLMLDGQTVTLPLKEIRRIVTVTHGARTGMLAGAISLTAFAGVRVPFGRRSALVF